MKKKIWYTYDEIHHVIKQLAAKIQAADTPYDAMIAIGGGGFIPARILRCFLDIPIYAVTTAYYDSDNEGQTTESVRKIQWIDPLPSELRGKNVLVVAIRYRWCSHRVCHHGSLSRCRPHRWVRSVRKRCAAVWCCPPECGSRCPICRVRVG